MTDVDTSLYENEIDNTLFPTLLIGADSEGAVRAYYMNSTYFANTPSENYTMFLTFNQDGTTDVDVIAVTNESEFRTVQVQNNTDYKIRIILGQANPQTTIVDVDQLSPKVKAPFNNLPANSCPNLQVYVDLTSEIIPNN